MADRGKVGPDFDYSLRHARELRAHGGWAPCRNARAHERKAL